jgi:hypothetical protein
VFEDPPAVDGIEVVESRTVELFDVANDLLIRILVPRESLRVKVDRDEVRRIGGCREEGRTQRRRRELGGAFRLGNGGRRSAGRRAVQCQS